MSAPSAASRRREDPSQVRDDNAFELLQAVLAGERSFSLDGDSSKMLRILIEHADADARLTPGDFAVDLYERRGRPHRYLLRLGPLALSELMARAGIDRIAGPVVLALPAADVGKVEDFSAWSYAACHVWIRPGTEEVTLAARTLRGPWRPPMVLDAALASANGLEQPPELPRWQPRPHRHVSFEEALRCAHCGEASHGYRIVDEVLICAACGRSFRPPA